MHWLRLAIGFGVLACFALSAQAQKIQGDWVWRPLLEHEGVVFKYIFYAEADNENNGVVVLLMNTNDYAVQYRFKMVFKSGDTEVVEMVEGEIGPHAAKTGDSSGLFWIPFPDGRVISEVGMRGYRVARKDTSML